MLIYLFLPLGKYLFIWRHQILFAESSIFRCSTQDLFFSYSMWDQVPLGIKPRSPALGHGVLATGPQGSLPPGFYIVKGIESRGSRDTCTAMFIAAFFTIVRRWKQPSWPLMGE